MPKLCKVTTGATLLNGTEIRVKENENVGTIQAEEMKYLRSKKECTRLDEIKTTVHGTS
jgi:hypothetical protein